MPIGFFLFRLVMFMRYIIRIFAILYIFTLEIAALDLSKKYPSYSYVFNEFDIDKSYIHDSDFEQFVLINEKNLKAFYKRSLLRGKEVLPTMKKILVGEGVSDLFIYLSMIESGFSTKAVSPKKAVGLWQFMPATAKHYNLTVCNGYDERCDTKSSTVAAMHYLNKLYKQFGKWYLAAMAYNCGEGCIENAINKAGTDELTILTDDVLKYLPRETRDYIKKILLVAMIGENNTLDFSNGVIDGLTEVEISGDTDLKKLAILLKMEYSTLQKINQNIKNEAMASYGKSVKIMIPLDKVFAFYLKYEVKKSNINEKKNLISHYVLIGESIESIAKNYNIKMDEIINTNHLEDNYLTVGQLLIIPVSREVFENVEKGTSK